MGHYGTVQDSALRLHEVYGPSTAVQNRLPLLMDVVQATTNKSSPANNAGRPL